MIKSNIIADQHGVYFTMGPTDGVLRLSQLINARELASNPFTLRIHAHDGGKPQLSATKELVIEVQQTPQLQQSMNHSDAVQVMRFY